MKAKVKKDIKGKTIDELAALLLEARQVLFSSQQDLRMNKLKNARQIFHKKKEIAVIMSYMNQKEELIK